MKRSGIQVNLDFLMNFFSPCSVAVGVSFFRKLCVNDFRENLQETRNGQFFERFCKGRSVMRTTQGYLTIRPFARKGYRSIAHEAKPNGLLTRGPVRG